MATTSAGISSPCTYQCAHVSVPKPLHVWVQLSPIIDRTVLKTVKAAFGGRVRFVVSGGAPLGPSVEAFLNITLCCPVLQVTSV